MDFCNPSPMTYLVMVVMRSEPSEPVEHISAHRTQSGSLSLVVNMLMIEIKARLAQLARSPKLAGLVFSSHDESAQSGVVSLCRVRLCGVLTLALYAPRPVGS